MEAHHPLLLGTNCSQVTCKCQCPAGWAPAWQRSKEKCTMKFPAPCKAMLPNAPFSRKWPLRNLVLGKEFDQCIPCSRSNSVFLSVQDCSKAEQRVKRWAANIIMQECNLVSPPLLLEVAAIVPPKSSSL